jgi:hypothetical protein
LGKIQEDTSIIAPAEKFDCVIYYRPPSPANEELTAGAPKVIEKRILERCMPALEELVKSGKRFGVYNPYAQLIFKG